ncbi:MAG: hypothetical protein WDA02_05795 [Saccharofermentanales bacterium]
MKKSIRQIEIENRLYSDLSNMVLEFQSGQLTEELIYNYFKLFLSDANVDSEIIVNVLENDRFGKLGKEEALSIKINEGW